MRVLITSLLPALACVAAATASASQIISTSTVTDLSLGVKGNGEAMLTYTSRGRVVHVLAWGAKNALPLPLLPTPQQLNFQLEYDGGYARYFTHNPAAQAALVELQNLQHQMANATAAHDIPTRYALKPKIAAAYAALETLRSHATNYWKTFTCPAYDGPALKGVLVACSAPDGSYWAIETTALQLAPRATANAAPSTDPGIQLAHWTTPDTTSTNVVSASAVTDISLGVNGTGEAMVTYTTHGKTVRVLAHDDQTSAARYQQVAFQTDYTGGYVKYFSDNPVAQAALANLRHLQAQSAAATGSHNNKARYALGPQLAAAYATLAGLRTTAENYWQTFTCPTYTGPPLADLVVACDSPDGSYWAVQSWDRDLPDYGTTPTTAQSQLEVHLSHWTGPLPVLTVHADWAYGGQWNHLWGSYTYNGQGVYGYRSTTHGQPLDSFGRNLYVDTLNSVYGSGWRRENSFLTHQPGGTWCYSVNPHATHPAGTGTQYRLTILGPGVTPDISVTVHAPGPYNRATQEPDDAALAALHDPACIPHD